MAVYGNIVSSNNTITNMDYILEEGNNICKILESINVLNENGIITEKVDFKGLKEKIINFLKMLKTKIAEFVKMLVNRIKELLGKVGIAMKITEYVEIVNTDYYIKLQGDLIEKYDVIDITLEVCRNNESDSIKYEESASKLEKANEELAEALNELKDEGNNSAKKILVKGESLKECLSKIERINFDKVQKDIDKSLASIENASLAEESIEANRFAVFSGLMKFWTINGTYWQNIQRVALENYNTLRKWAANHKAD